MTIVSVAFTGPPLVRIQGSSKSCSAQMDEVTTTKASTGLRSGSVIRRKLCQAVAPSTAATS